MALIAPDVPTFRAKYFLSKTPTPIVDKYPSLAPKIIFVSGFKPNFCTYSASTFPTTYSGLAKLGNFSGSSSILSSNFLSQVKVWRLSKPVPAAIVVSVTIVPVKRQIIYSLIPIHFCTCAKSLGFSSLIHSNLYTGAIG